MRHSKRTHCRCSFTVKWLDRPLEEALTVPASAIMKLATQSISLHPIISTIFTMLESSNGLGRSPYSIIVDTMSLESALLDKQIMKISNSTDVSPKKISKDFSFGLQGDHLNPFSSINCENCPFFFFLFRQFFFSLHTRSTGKDQLLYISVNKRKEDLQHVLMIPLHRVGSILI